MGPLRGGGPLSKMTNVFRTGGGDFETNTHQIEYHREMKAKTGKVMLLQDKEPENFHQTPGAGLRTQRSFSSGPWMRTALLLPHCSHKKLPFSKPPNLCQFVMVAKVTNRVLSCLHTTGSGEHEKLL